MKTQFSSAQVYFVHNIHAFRVYLKFYDFGEVPDAFHRPRAEAPAAALRPADGQPILNPVLGTRRAEAGPVSRAGRACPRNRGQNYVATEVCVRHLQGWRGLGGVKRQKKAAGGQVAEKNEPGTLRRVPSLAALSDGRGSDAGEDDEGQPQGTKAFAKVSAADGTGPSERGRALCTA